MLGSCQEQTQRCKGNIITAVADSFSVLDNAGNISMFLSTTFYYKVAGGKQMYLLGKISIQHVHRTTFAIACTHIQEMDMVLHVLHRNLVRNTFGEQISHPY